MIRHRCDQPLCFRYSHLLLGTAQDNVNDMIERGRDRKVWGEGRPHKLTEEQAREIKRRALAGEGLRALGREFGVGHNIVGGIKIGRDWPHLD